jgi:N-acetyl-gamma-glutamyl-phosphate reductase
LVAVAGCYPTAALNGLKPLKQANLLADDTIIVNAVSGVTGAGRKANIGTQFCEVSLMPYGLFNHRHTPEISQYLGHSVLFTPHLGNFARGILETIYVKLKTGVSEHQVNEAFQVLADKPLIRLKGTKQMPSIKGVAKQPYVDIGWQVQGEQLILVVAIDNLLKGAAGQALQCMNIAALLPAELGLKGVS